MAFFVRPSTQDLEFVRCALEIFGEASGLRVNYSKSSAILITNDAEDRARLQSLLQCPIDEFPCRYLGLQLAIKNLTKAQWQPLLDQVRHFIPAWQRGLMQRPGRLILVKSVIAARPVHQLLVMKPPIWVLEDMDSWMRAFFWAGKDWAHGGQCLVAWNAICKPLTLGGLGVKNLGLQDIALRVRWEWLWRTDDRRPWQGLQFLVDEDARMVFDSLVKIEVERGTRFYFGEIDRSMVLQYKTLPLHWLVWLTPKRGMQER